MMCSREPKCAPEDAGSGRIRLHGHRIWPVAVLAAGLALFFATGLQDYVSFETLRIHRAEVLAFVEGAGVGAVVAFIILYAVSIAFSLPVGALFTIVGGFVFGPIVGTAAAVCGATVGSTAVFLVARTAFGKLLRSKAGKRIDRIASGFEEDAFSYLLTLRLVPVFPFWLVNIAPAFTRVRLRTYVIATALGIIPGTLVYALVGNGLGAVFEAGAKPDLQVVFEPEILLPIVGLALLSLSPVAYKRIRRRPERPGEMRCRERKSAPSRPMCPPKSPAQSRGGARGA